MSALISWYSQQYGSWNRTRRLAVPPFLARTDTRASQLARTQSRGRQGQDQSPTQAEGDVVINMNNGRNLQPATANNAVTTPPANDEQTPKNKDTLFGPNIGVVSSGPGWTCLETDKNHARAGKDGNEKDSDDSGDELTPEIVRGWIAKSKEPSEPTTTLQALVNLKRPTIRLSPLAHDPSHTHSRSLTAADSQHDDPSASTDRLSHHSHAQQHGLEFEFDCDAPKCGIAVHVFGVPASLGEEYHLQHHTSAPRASTSDVERDAEIEKNRLLIFETTLDGGFGRKLDLDAGATLELARLEQAAIAATNIAAAAAAAKSEKNAKDSADGGRVESGDSPGETRHKKRLTFFRRKHHNNSQSTTNGAAATRTPRPVTGPALAVVDAEAHAPTPSADSNAQGKPKGAGAEDEEGGVKVTIRLSALDAEGRPAFGARNEQTTYLHVVRVGTPPVRPEAAEGAEEGESEEEDTRPWVVKVVKREATIGPHSFHLHEIYGLSSHSAEPSHPIAPTAPTPNANAADAHSYPPPAAPPAVTHANDDDSTSECLLCLSSPREVVLLPCRHLVACRECAVNMVEFGAGGTLVHNDTDQGATGGAATATAAGTEGGGDANANGTGTTAGEEAGAPSSGVVQPVPPPAPSRRKRKAKGWFCPVCRQPYTSLLRITTSPPPPKEPIDAKRVSMASGSDVDHDHEHDENDVNQTLATHPTGVFPYPDTTAAAANTQRGGNSNGNGNGNGIIGGVANLMRPGFLRSLTSRSANAGPGTGASTAPMNATELVDLERGRVTAVGQ